MQEPYWWYVLYVRSNTEHRVVESFQKSMLKKGLSFEIETFCPESEKYYRDKHSRTLGKTYIKRPLFPGYVFVGTNMPEIEFRAQSYDIIYNSMDIIRLLCNGKDGGIALRQDERERFEFILKGKRCLEHSIGYIEGDRTVVTFGPLRGRENIIKKINRHSREAYIEIDMFGVKNMVKVALEILSKINV